MPRLRASASSICSSSRFGPSLSYLVTLLSPSTGDVGAELGKRVPALGRMAKIDWPVGSLRSAAMHLTVCSWALTHVRRWTFWLVAPANIKGLNRPASADMLAELRNATRRNRSRFRFGFRRLRLDELVRCDATAAASLSHYLVLSSPRRLSTPESHSDKRK